MFIFYTSMYVNPLKNVQTNYIFNQKRISFKSNSMKADSFERSSDKIKGFWITNPYDHEIYETDKIVDITKPQHFKWIVKRLFSFYKNVFTADFEPDKTGILFDKKTKNPIEVFIVKSHSTKDDDIDGFHFFSKDLRKEYGKVIFTNDYESCSKKLSSDYEKEGITGDRIVVLWLENRYDGQIGGVGKLADKLAVRYCIEKGIEPNIVSVAYNGSEIAHYKRGKRFFEPLKDSPAYKFLLDKYGTSNPNEVFENMIKNSEKTGAKIDLSPFGNCEGLAMYLPKNLVKQYK